MTLECRLCDEPATKKAGNQWLCAKHYRFKQMRSCSKSAGKYQPTWVELEGLHKSMSCPDCSRAMGWFRSESGDTTISLQHYADGTLALVCLRCNIQHGRMPGDSWRTLPPGSKLCQRCDTVKLDSEFNADNRTSAVKKRATSCKVCMGLYGSAWSKNNREKANASLRRWRLKKSIQNQLGGNLDHTKP